MKRYAIGALLFALLFMVLACTQTVSGNGSKKQADRYEKERSWGAVSETMPGRKKH